jgi:hypothetical protein
LVHCRDLSFTTYYSHIKAHQDDNESFDKLDRKAQLNCIWDHAAKQRIVADGTDGTTQGRLFPLEPIGIFVRGEKMTSETGEQIRFWAHHQLAQKIYHERKMLSYKQFDNVDWVSIHCTLHDLPRLFQVWAAKHVLSVAGTMHFLLHQDMRSSLCLSCQECLELCKHIARCPNTGWTHAFMQSVTGVEIWMEKNSTHPDLRSLLLKYLRGRGTITCAKCSTALNMPHIIQEFAVS